MIKKLVFLVVIGIGSLFSIQTVVAQDKEIELAKVPLNNYLQGQATGNSEFIRRAFDKDARIISFREGKLNNLSIDEFAAFFKGKTAEDEAKRKRTIERLDVSGNVAIAKIVLDYPAIKFVDYMSLLKTDGEWKIVNKSFFAEPRNNTAKDTNFKSADEEKPAVEFVIKTYLKGYQMANVEFFKQSLWAEGSMKFIENSKYSSLIFQDFFVKFAENTKGKPAADESQRKRTIETIEISGNVAAAKILSDYPKVKYFEYITLLKIKDEWKIVSKIFYREPKDEPKQK